MSPNPSKPNPKNPNSISVKVDIPHKDQIPIWMHDFIEKVVDVADDGLCGFRAVAGLRSLSVDDHQMICYHLHKELTGEGNVCYRQMINDDRQYKEVLGALTFFGIGLAPPDKWMTMMDMGFLIAQKYNDTVVLLSTKKGQFVTFFLYGDDCPIPPTWPLWRQHARDDAKSWLDRYISRMTDYNELFRAKGVEVIGDNQDLYIIKNLDQEYKVVAGKKVEDGVKIEKEDNFNPEDMDIDFGAV
ncbi:hypothetical protein MTR_7g109380 [Medicago truncatula]|uniref:OTU domain-containing protein n=1 Tax=Medicago truncatula TaxID=3880 RepID=G7KSS3_MEDTR|nr:hypothetical protein MTR_7g109380 [Medicago truncatula]